MSEATTTAGETPILDARELLDRYGLRAKKSWGQNFLVDERAYRAIVAACGLSSGEIAVEIGAGLGTLTSRLLATGAQVVAVERERDMCEVLSRELGGQPRFTLRCENALHLDLSTVARQPLVVVGNLPYQIAAPLIFHFLEQRERVKRLVIMVQREVADRILAAPGSEAYSSISAQLQLVFAGRRVCQVGRSGFLPPPRVESTVVLLETLAQPAAVVSDRKRYGQVVRAAFGQRRKTLRNALSAVFGEAALPALAATGIDLGRRGETLSVAEFARLAEAAPDPVSDVDSSASRDI